jgi:hypothetical protein
LSISQQLTPCPVDNVVTIDKSSDSFLWDEFQKIENYFNKEFDYGCIPNKNCTPLLFTQEAIDVYKEKPMPYRIYGACAFEKITTKEDGDLWRLGWIWLHPFFRNRGYIKKHWPVLEKRFGNFLIKEPVSNSMLSFLKRVDPSEKHIIY